MVVKANGNVWMIDVKAYKNDFNRQMKPYQLRPLEQRQRAYDRYRNDFDTYLTSQGVEQPQKQAILAEFSEVEPRTNEPTVKYLVGDRVNDVMVGTGNLVKNLLSIVPSETPYIGEPVKEARDFVKQGVRDWENDYSPRYKLEKKLSERDDVVYPTATISHLLQEAPKFIPLAWGTPAAVGINAIAGVGEVLDGGGRNFVNLAIGGALGGMDGFAPQLAKMGWLKELGKQIGQDYAQDKNVQYSIGW